MTTHGTNKVIVVGAGFSAAAGLPASTDLLPLICEKIPDGEIADGFHPLETIRDVAGVAHGLLESKAPPNPLAELNIELFFDMFQYRITQWSMIPGDASRNVETLKDRLLIALIGTIYEAQVKAKPTIVDEFVKHLGDGDCIVSFNYDTLIEEALERAGRSCNHGFDSENSTGTTILKMHGSIDWVLKPSGVTLGNYRQLIPGQQPIGQLSSSHGRPDACGSQPYTLWRAQADEARKNITELLKPNIWQDTNGNLSFGTAGVRRGIAGLGSFKPLSELTGSDLTWRKAYQSLKNANRIIVAGFSMSDFDRMAQMLFFDVAKTRKRPISPQVIDIKSNKRSFRARFRRSFGRCRFVRQDFAEADWSTLLC